MILLGAGLKKVKYGFVCLEYFLVPLFALCTVIFFLKFDYLHPFNFSPPFEDASMLFRYANNLAHGGGLAWNYGQHPGATDGATDLGFVLCLAPLVYFGINVVTAAASLNFLSIVWSSLVIRFFLRKQPVRTRISLSVIFVLVVFSGPTDRYLKSGFSPTILGSLYLTIVVLILEITESEAERPKFNLILAGLLSGLAGWWRPEGFFFSTILGLFAIFSTKFFAQDKLKQPLRLTAQFIIPLVLVFAGWCIFRLNYFGHLLPTSAVMKAESGYHWSNFVDSLKFLFIGGAPLLFIFLIFRIKNLLGYYFCVFLLTIILSASWIPVSTTLNWWHRMQWPLIPSIALFIFVPFRERALEKNDFSKFFVYLSFVVVATSFCFDLRQHQNERVNFPIFTQRVANVLESANTKAVRLATTEAGLIPLSINGEALDTYGWNDYQIAVTDGLALISRLVSFNPNLIIVHGVPVTDTVNTDCQINYFTTKWNSMTNTLVGYANSHHMALLRSTLTAPCDAWTIFVNRDLPPEIVKALKLYQLSGQEVNITKYNS